MFVVVSDLFSSVRHTIYDVASLHEPLLFVSLMLLSQKIIQSYCLLIYQVIVLIKNPLAQFSPRCVRIVFSRQCIAGAR